MDRCPDDDTPSPLSASLIVAAALTVLINAACTTSLSRAEKFASEQGFEVRCNVHAFDKVSHALEQKGLKPDSAEIAYIPTTTVPVTEVHIAKTVLKLHDTLEEHDDVQAVFSNEEMDDAVSAATQT